jgi:hypothetical protein
MTNTFSTRLFDTILVTFTAGSRIKDEGFNIDLATAEIWKQSCIDVMNVFTKIDTCHTQQMIPMIEGGGTVHSSRRK